MKRSILLVLFCLIGLSVNAQSHMKFLGISMGGGITPFTDEMVTKGYSPLYSGVYQQSEFVDACSWQNFIGDFWEFKDATILVRSYQKDSGVSLVQVQLVRSSREQFNRLILSTDKKYGKHTIKDEEILGGVIYIWQTPSGNVEIWRSEFWEGDGRCNLTITYKDFTLVKREAQANAEKEKNRALHKNDL